MSTEQNPHRPSEPVQPTVEIPAPTAAYPTRPGTGEPDAPGDPGRSSTTPADGDSDGDHGTDRAGDAPLVRTGPRSSTVVWGFVVVAVALGLLASAAGASVDAQLGAIVLLAVAGVLLVGTSVTGAARRRRKQSAVR